MKKLFLMGLCVFILSMLVFAKNAQAYIDPSALTYIIQAAAGLFIAGGAAIAIFWQRIKLFFSKRKKK